MWLEGQLQGSLILAIQVVTVWLTLRIAHAHRMTRIVSTVTLILALIVAVGTAFMGETDRVTGLVFLTSSVLYLIAPIAILRALGRRPEIDREAVLGAIDAYLFVGMFFANAYQAIGAFDPPLFEGSGHVTAAQALFFSFTTMTTTGYGNLVPAGELAQTASVAEMLIGQLFLVTAVAKVITAWRPARWRAAEGDEGGEYGSPERTLVFDVNDFDETLPGPFEYDVARLVASVVIASRNNGFSAAYTASVAQSSVMRYRTAMGEFAEMGTLDIWYSRLDAEAMLARAAEVAGKKGRKAVKRGQKVMQKARTKDSLQALSKLTQVVDGHHRIISDPPIVVPARDLLAHYDISPEAVQEAVHGLFRAYRSTLPDDRRRLLERFEFVDFARKVVGVGSVGTRAWIALFQGRNGEDPLFLQLKQATRSVLEDHLPKSRFRQPGERVVQGQRLMQASSDVFLGWTKGVETGVYYYWRQLRDMKGSADPEQQDPRAMFFYAQACAWTLARAHARSGDPVAIATYLGKGDGFDRAMTDFATRYADQNERDYEAFIGAIASGKLEAIEGI